MLRLLTLQDLPQLLALEAACQLIPWSEEVFKKCLEAGSSGWVLELDKEMIGFILTLAQLDEVHILNFCINPAYQGRGYGKQLTSHMLQNINPENQKLVYLEVRRSNINAISLYEKVGFSKIGERKDYYLTLDQREDAFIYAKQLI